MRRTGELMGLQFDPLCARPPGADNQLREDPVKMGNLFTAKQVHCRTRDLGEQVQVSRASEALAFVLERRGVEIKTLSRIIRIL